MTPLLPTILTLLVSVANATPLSVPAELRNQTGALKENFSRYGYRMSEHPGGDPDPVIRNWYQWVSDAMQHNAPADVVKALASVLPINEHEGELEWSARRATIGPQERRPDPLVGSVLTWQGGGRSLLVFRIDAARMVEGQPGYLVSTPPIFIAKDEQGLVIGGNRGAADMGAFGAAYTFEGLLESPDPAWPDVVLVTGPGGSGVAVNVEQHHASAPAPREWKVIWRVPFTAVTDVKYDAAGRSLTVAYYSGQVTSARLHFAYGAPGQWQ